jgi:hypothetical protein
MAAKASGIEWVGLSEGVRRLRLMTKRTREKAEADASRAA